VVTVAAGEKGERTEHVEAIFLDTRGDQSGILLRVDTNGENSRCKVFRRVDSSLETGSHENKPSLHFHTITYRIELIEYSNCVFPDQYPATPVAD